MRKMGLAMALTTLLTAPALAAADLAVSPLFGSNMVIQRGQPIIIWGAGDPGGRVEVTVGGLHAEASVASSGEWEVTLGELPAGGPHELVVRSGDESATFKNVMTGDVWLCTGQSNMYWRVDQSDDHGPFVENAERYADVRLVQIEREWDRDPRESVGTIGWRRSVPDTVARFSAVGFHFGRILNAETGVPIGLIQTCWGGTPAEAWTPMAAIESRPEVFNGLLASVAEYDIPDAEAQRIMAEAQAQHESFAAFAWKNGIGQNAGWHEAQYDDRSWPTIELPGYIDGALGSFDGIVWLRKEVDLPRDFDGRAGKLDLSRVDDYDETYVNGTMVGATRMDNGGESRSRRLYDIPAGVLKPGRNVVSIRLMDVRSSGGVIPEDRPFELIAGDTRVPLAGDWRYSVGFDARDHGGFPRPASHATSVGRPYRRSAVLYNAMIHPLRRLGVAGAIWYQGESNAGRGEEYRELLPTMIESWRAAWAEARGQRDYRMPFYIVQLPNYRDRKDEPGESSWAALREAQRLTDQRVADTGLAITIDLGDPADIHPTNKIPVSERLARLALHDLYGQPAGPRTGPLPTDATLSGSEVVVRFENAEGLRTVDNGHSVYGFELAGEDGRFVRADARIRGETVRARAEAVPHPVRVRYAWADNPLVNLVNRDGLPASTFEFPIAE
jgi:sialate O-acetylesterase